MGRAESDFSSSDFGSQGQGVRAKHDSSARYYGMRLGAGYVRNIAEAASLDMCGKYFRTHRDGGAVRLSAGDRVDFEAVDSRRPRLGGRLAYAANDFINPYVGAAFEGEFDGQARASANGLPIESPKPKGSTFIGELGLSVVPFGQNRRPAGLLSIDLGIQGYAGKREGIAGGLGLKFEF